MTTLHLLNRNQKPQPASQAPANCSSQSSANKVHDLNSIIFGENCFGPLIAPDHLVVKFDRNPRRSQREFGNEIIQSRPIPQLAAFTVNLNAQCFLC